QGRSELASHYFDKATELATKGGLHEETIAIALIRVEESTPSRKAESLDMLIQLKDQAKTYELAYMQLEILSKMISLSKDLGLYEQTVQWMEEHGQIEKQLFDERKSRDIANLHATYELEKSKQEVG